MQKVKELIAPDSCWCFKCRNEIQKGERIVIAKDKAKRLLRYHKACWQGKVDKGQRKLRKELSV